MFDSRKQLNSVEQPVPTSSDNGTKTDTGATKRKAQAEAPSQAETKHLKSEQQTGNGVTAHTGNGIQQNTDFIHNALALNKYLEAEGYTSLWLQKNIFLVDNGTVSPLLPYDNESKRPAGKTSVRLFGKDNKLYFLSYRLMCECIQRNLVGKEKLIPKPLAPACNAYIVIQKIVGDEVLLEMRVNRGRQGAHSELVNDDEDMYVKSALMGAGEVFTDDGVILVTDKTGAYFKTIDRTKVERGLIEKQFFAPFYSKRSDNQPNGFYPLQVSAEDGDGMKGVAKQLKALGYEFVKDAVKPITVASNDKNKVENTVNNTNNVSVTAVTELYAKPPTNGDAAMEVSEQTPEASRNFHNK